MHKRTQGRAEGRIHALGQFTADAEEGIKKELGDTDRRQTGVASIGPAGEKLMRISAIINDLREACGRSGMGALMTSKKVKAHSCKET